MMAMDEAETLRLARKLEAKAKDSAESINFFRGIGRYVDAVDYYEKAADKYIMVDDNKDAARCYIEASKLYKEHILPSSNGQQTKYLKLLEQTATAQKEYSEKDSIATFEQVALGRQAINDFSQAGDIYKKLAMLHEAKEQWDPSIHYYNLAYDSFKTGNCPTKGATCKLQVGNIYTQKAEYLKSYEAYIELATEAKEEKTMQHELYTFMFKAMLCAFVLGADKDDMGFVRQQNDKCAEIDGAWTREKECRTLDKLIKCYEKRDEKGFRKEFTEYKHCSNVDEFTITLLTRVIRALKGVPSGDAPKQEKKDFTDDGIDLS
jgi:tetratricopeptide (TPR) repeat protein